MKILSKYFKHFILRGLVAMGFGPIVLSVVYLILGFVGATENISVYEMSLGILTMTLLAFMAGGITTVYQIEEISLPKAIGAHCLVLYACYAVVYLINGWLEDGIIPFLVFTGIFLVGFALIWLIIYLCTKQGTEAINKKIKR